MNRIAPILNLVAAAILTVTGYFLIGFHCPYGFIATIMTGRIQVSGIWGGVPYKWILAIAVCLVLHTFYVWTRRNDDPKRAMQQFADPALFMCLSVALATVGFLALSYPCPIPMDLWVLLGLEVDLDGIGIPVGIPYGAILALAAGLLLYAFYARARQKRVADAI
jgi:hypothetical protein